MSMNEFRRLGPVEAKLQFEAIGNRLPRQRRRGGAGRSARALLAHRVLDHQQHAIRQDARAIPSAAGTARPDAGVGLPRRPVLPRPSKRPDGTGAALIVEKQCPRAGWTDSVLRAGGRAPFVRIGLLRNSKCLCGLKLELRSHWANKQCIALRSYRLGAIGLRYPAVTD